MTINQGYTITDSISIAGQTYVMGHNPNAPDPYVTWLAREDGGYTFGHYLATEESARKDLFKRALEVLPEHESQAIVLDNLSDEDRAAIEEDGRMEIRLGDIEACLLDGDLGFDEAQVSTIMADESFITKALHRYHNIDHSNENEALAESLADLIKEKFPHYMPQEATTTLKISPEEMSILNDVLSLTEKELCAKYGELDPGEGLLIFFKDVESPTKTAHLRLEIEPRVNQDDENLIHLYVSTGRHLQMDEAKRTYHNVASLEQVFSIQDKNGFTWNLDIHADERLRRIGKEFTFTTDSDSPEYTSRIGEFCIVERLLTKEENETTLSGGLMWKARFEDGTVLDVWDHELKLPRTIQFDLDINPEQKKPIQPQPLDNLLTSAQQRVAQNGMPTSPHEPQL